MRKVFSGLWRETVIVGELIVVLMDPCSITALLLLIKWQLYCSTNIYDSNFVYI